uniref:Integrase catalytic domain-containing protein n=1 Tax=Caenorhabditis japonica TaxID=281687 RepID=A0A8R1E5E5_CAEJA
MIDDIFRDQLDKDIIEEVHEKNEGNGFIHYNPHQPVLTPQKTTTKCRVVVDGSSHFKNKPSLNDVIRQGPVILPDLIHMLIRFRGGKTAILSDVEKAFLQVRLHEADRDATRVLWIKDLDKPATNENLVIYRFTRVLFGLNVSPYLLAGTILFHLEKHPNRRLADEMAKNLYVDNLILTTDEVPDKAIQLYEETKRIFLEMNMNLREFISNSPEFNKMLAEKDRSAEDVQKVLGLRWNTISDEIVMKVELPQIENNSRRTISSVVAAEFDPLGLTVPLMLELKKFQRELWENETDWDTPLKPQQEDEWKKILQERAGFEKRLARNVISKSGTNNLVTFTDASKDATACAIYVVNNQGAFIIFAKSKVRQLKERWTIPKLEMEALAMGAKQTESVWTALTEGNINIEKVIFMTDSEIALQWMKTDPTRKEVGTLITNRLKTIHEAISQMDTKCQVRFGHVDTKQNPADLGTRGMNKNQFGDCIWWKGPSFLLQPIEKWPNQKSIFCSTPTQKYMMHTRQEIVEKQEQIFQKERTYSYKKMKRVIAYVLKFISLTIRNLPITKQNEIRNSIPELQLGVPGELTVREIQAGEMALIRDHQKEINSKQLKKMKDLWPRINAEKLIVSQGRMGNAEIEKGAKEPMIIMPNSHLSKMIIWDAHGKWHKGIDHTMAEVRKKYWIPKLRSQTKKVLQRCVPCQKLVKHPFHYPETGQLPRQRVTITRPFENTGLDYFGPMEYIRTEAEKGKAYGCILTCAVTRLVHIEIVQDESTTSFIQAIRRFIALRGIPKRIISDNAPTFVLGSKIIGDAAATNSLSQEVKDFLGQEEIEWAFITPYSPWKGGFYERMVKTSKHAFLKGIRNNTKSLTFEEMSTCFMEVSASINTRPLTYIEDEVGSRVLRPSDFIYQDLRFTLPLEDILEESEEYRPSREANTKLTRTETIQALESSVKASGKIWKIWKEKYLSELRSTHKKRIDKKRGHPAIPLEGQLVYICDEDQPRNYWRLGLITKTVKSGDGEIREVHLKVKPKNKPCTTIRRSPNMIIPLEISYDDDNEETTPDSEKTNEDESKNETLAAKTSEPKREERYNLRHRKPVNYKENSDSLFMGFTWSQLGIHKGILLTIVAAICLLPGLQAIGNEENEVIECTNTGLRLNANYESFEICVRDYCTNRPRFQWSNGPVDIWIPLAIKTNPHRATTKIFDGKDVRIWEKDCPAVSTCNAIDCTFCLQNIFNPECAPYAAWIGIGGSLYVAGLIIYCCCQVPITLGGPIKILWTVLQMVIFIILNLGRTILPRRRRVAWPERIALGIIAASICLSTNQCCQEIDVIRQEQIECIKEGKDENCSFITEEFLKLNSIHKEACLRIYHNGTVFKEIRLQFIHAQLKCIEESIIFTKEIETKLWSTKRCAHMGSCSEDKCLAIKPNSMIPELESTKKFVGTTGCTESCGGPGCDCFFPSSACIFYRIYGVPKSDEVYELFKCVEWEKTLKIKMTKTSLNSMVNRVERLVLSLPVNEPRILEDTKATANFISTPPSPALNTWFIRSNLTIAEWSNNELPAYQCYTAKKAEVDECQLHERCQCTPAETEMKCRCDHPEIMSKFNNIRTRLPIQKGYWKIEGKGRSVTATISEEVSSEVSLRWKGKASIAILKDKDQCRIEDTHISGCYSCATGGKVNITCYSKATTTIANIICEEKMFTVSCGPKGHNHELTFFVTKAQFRKRCSVECGGEMSNELEILTKEMSVIYTKARRIENDMQYLQTKKEETSQLIEEKLTLTNVRKMIDIGNKLAMCMYGYAKLSDDYVKNKHQIEKYRQIGVFNRHEVEDAYHFWRLHPEATIKEFCYQKESYDMAQMQIAAEITRKTEQLDNEQQKEQTKIEEKMSELSKKMDEILSRNLP